MSRRAAPRPASGGHCRATELDVAGMDQRAPAAPQTVVGLWFVRKHGQFDGLQGTERFELNGGGRVGGFLAGVGQREDKGR